LLEELLIVVMLYDLEVLLTDLIDDGGIGFQLHIRKVPSSKHGLVKFYLDEAFSGFPHFL
jgi:hypothetical protein